MSEIFAKLICIKEVFADMPTKLARQIAQLKMSPITTVTPPPQTSWCWYRCNVCGSRFKGEGCLDIWCMECHPEYPDVEWFKDPKVNDLDYLGEGTFNAPPPVDECAHPDRPNDQLCLDCPRRVEPPWCTCSEDFECEGHRT